MSAPEVRIRPIDSDPVVLHPEYEAPEAARYLENLGSAEWRQVVALRVTCPEPARSIFTFPVNHAMDREMNLAELKRELYARANPKGRRR